MDSGGMRTRRPDEEPEFNRATKVLGAVCVVGTAALIFAAFRYSRMPSHAELRSLVSTDETFSVRHVGIMRRFYAACNGNIQKMMQLIREPAMESAKDVISSNFPPAKLPASTTFDLVVKYPDRHGSTITSTLLLDSDTGAKLYKMGRTEMIQKYCTEKIMPGIQQVFTDFANYVRQGLSDLDIFGMMTSSSYRHDIADDVAANALPRVKF